MFRTIFIGLFLFLFIFSVKAQDISFSQSYVSSPYLNPALTGIFNGTVRVGAQYRSQWNNPLDVAFETYAASGDLNYNIKLFDKTASDILGVGILFINDRIEGIDFNTSMIALSTAYHKALNPRKQHYLGIGLQLGVIQKNVNYDQLLFADQFDNINSYSFPTSEPIPTNNFAVGDLGVGVLYLISPTKKLSIRAGLAFHHITTPNISFFRFDEDIVNNNIMSKLTLHASADIKTGPFVSLVPKMIINSQGPYLDIELGNNVKFTTFDLDDLSFHAGASVHAVKDLESVFVSTVVPFLGFQMNNVLIGMSYDIGINTLVQNGRNFSTFEFSLSYLGEHDNQPMFCPKF